VPEPTTRLRVVIAEDHNLVREGTRRLLGAHPEIGVVILSQHADSGYAVRLLQHGSDGLAYLLKGRVADVDHVVLAQREVVAGRSVIDAALVDTLLEARRASRPRSPSWDWTPGAIGPPHPRRPDLPAGGRRAQRLRCVT